MVFSEQEILACTPNPNQCGGTGGCSGATQELAFAYIQRAGITTEAQWPYTMQSGTCDWTGKTPVANVTGWAALPFNNYTALMNAVVSIGPIAISAAAEPWQSYDKGVFSSPCGADVDHAIVLEGYGTDAKSGLDYYLVRNSWSAGWGEEVRVARDGAKKGGRGAGGREGEQRATRARLDERTGARTAPYLTLRERRTRAPFLPAGLHPRCALRRHEQGRAVPHGHEPGRRRRLQGRPLECVSAPDRP